MKKLLIPAALAVLAGCTNNHSLSVQAPASAKAGDAVTFTVTAFNNNQPDTGYSGTVHFASDDPHAVLPADYKFQGSDKGVHQFVMTLKTAGTRTVHAKDASNNVDSVVVIQLSPGPAAALVAASGDGQSAPIATVLPAPLVVQSTDAFGNIVPGVAITWTAVASKAQILSQVSTTGADGTASATVQLGNAVGAEGFQATAPSAAGSPSATFSETGAPPTAGLLQASSGDGQSNTAGTGLNNPLVVTVTDSLGDPVVDATVTWTAASGGGSVASQTSQSDGSGHASMQVVVGMTPGVNTFQASITGITGSPVTFTAQGVNGLAYTDPPAGGKIRLVRNSASTPTTAILDVVAAQDLTGFSVAMNLPLDASRVQMNTIPIIPGTALNPGTAPMPFGAVLPTTGPLASVLVSGQSQKAPAADATIPNGTVLYTLQIDEKTGAAAGTIFDGRSLPASFRAALRDHLGNDVVTSGEFSIGQLEAR